MTHAEAASYRDGRVMHDNYGPVIWGGTGERWDFLQLEKGGPPTGGDQLRERIRRLMANPGSAGEPATPQLSFKRSSSMQARGQILTVDLDEHGISWALAADLLALYDLTYTWDAEGRRILVGSLDVAPSFQEDQVQPSVGWPLVEMALQSGNSPVILRGILREQRAWCRVLEFAEEFGISTSFEPFTLLERRGG